MRNEKWKMKRPAPKTSKFAIAAAFQEIAKLLEAKRIDQFRARAYRNAARSITDFPGDLDTLAKQNRLTDIKGIGSGLAAQLKEILTTGRSLILEQLRAELSPGVLERVLLLHASRLGRQILEHMEGSPEVRHIAVAGAVRRWQETVGTIRIVASAKRTPARLIAHFLQLPSITEIQERTNRSCVVSLADNTLVSFTAVLPREYPVALHQQTGTKAHVEKMRTVAKKTGFTLTDTALLRVRPQRGSSPTPGSPAGQPRGGGSVSEGVSGREVSLKKESDLFRHLGMQYVPPELREDEGEIEQALAGKLPEDLLTISDIRGMVHCHTTYSDGRNTVAEMALAAEAMGMQYMTITDHSPTAFYANGVKLDRLMRQWDEISHVQETVKVKLLRGTESDILREGALDYPDRILEQFDVIIASIHNRYKLDEADMTRRLVTAMQNPLFKIWGHPLGRLVQKRPPIACRVEEVLDVIAASRAAIEINSSPHRLDLEPRWLKEARKRGIKFVVSTDAHSISDLNNLPFGIGLARRAGIRRREVLNTLGVRAFRKRVSPL
jgi:DNA polymerase (family 10)